MRHLGNRAIYATALAAAVAASTATCAVAKDFRLATIVPPAHLWNVYASKMGEAIEERTGGAHTLTVFPAGQLGDESQMVQQLQSGALDMAFLTVADISNRIPAFGAIFAPFLVPDVSEGIKVLNSEAAQSLLEEMPQSMGVVGLDYGMATMRQMIVSRPVNSAADMIGLKMRITPFAPARDFYNILGIAPTPMPLPDVYDALANGQVDAADVDIEQVMIFRFDEVANHLMLTNHSMFPMVGVVSARVWAGLSEEDRTIIREEMTKALDELNEEYAKIDSELQEKAGETDAVVTKVGADFFPGVVEKWEELWSEHMPLVEQFRAAVAAQ